MLSTAYRLRVEAICDKMLKGEAVELSEMIWVEKLSKVNRSVATMLRQTRRKVNNPDMQEDSLDGFLNALDLGSPDPTQHRQRFESADDIADFFHNEDGIRD